ncbi:MAG: PEGA domain-containing protein [Opitutales bacterium]|jgi:hypothetical protein
MKKAYFLIPIAVMLSACTSTQYDVQVTPSTASLSVMGTPPATLLKTPAGGKVTVPSGDASYTVSASLPGYETGNYTIRPGTSPAAPIRIDLAPLFLKKSFNFDSMPQGAQVMIDGKAVGRTPFTLEVEFARTGAASPWIGKKVEFSLADWQSESVALDSFSAASVSANLSCLRQERVFSVKVVTQDAQPLGASVSIDGKLQGSSPMDIPLVFARPDKTAPWPVYSCSVGIKDEYKEQTFSITRASPDVMTVTLAPVTEMGVKRMSPVVLVKSRGAQLVIDDAERIASVDTRERSGTAADLRQVTAFRRGEHRDPEVNSFTISPDGQSVVYALTEQDGDLIYSNLWQASTDVVSGARQRLTTGTYLDSVPQLPVGEAKQMLVFQSNRGLRDSVDISAIRLMDGRAVGGITQVSREARFNYAPVLLREEWELFFVSMEDHYPQAMPQISYMRTDGSAPTYLNEFGYDLALSPDGRQIYFVRKDSTTGKTQINSIPMEGYPLTQVIAQPAFNNANCSAPAINPEGNLMLFVCDMAQDESGRQNNDIYLLNMGTGKIIPVTSNISDDIAPAWSPVEPGVIYFLSNRGGCYNVWRLRLTDVQ